MKCRWIPVIGIALIVLCGCEDKEAKLAVKSLNEDARLVNRNVHVKSVNFTEQRRDAVRVYEANILNGKGEVVGKASGRRIEGFGTSRPQLEWYDEALADEALNPKDDTYKKLYEQTMKADADGDGRVTYEEAVAANPHLLRSAFDYLDRNGDGVISKEDLTYKGPPRRPWGGLGGGRRRNNGGLGQSGPSGT